MTRKEIKKILDDWRSAFGGVELVVVHHYAGAPDVTSPRQVSLDFYLGKRGLAWLPLGDSALPHIVDVSKVSFDRLFDILSFETDRITLRLQPLRTLDIVDAVNEWKKENPERLDMTTTLTRYADEGTL